MIKRIIKRLLPAQLILLYHYAMAVLANLLYGFPSRKMVIIGVTGTKGKTSTVNFIWSCLMAGGNKTGIISTANIRINKQERLNEYHMTMPGPFVLQKFMARMVKDGCTHCIIETTSEGIQQHRHVGIYYDIAVFTNLFPEHLQAHGGSFEAYQQMKGRMFTMLFSHKKHINGKPVKKVIIANRDSEHADYFLSFPADKHITFGVRNKANFFAHTIEETTLGVNFMIGEAAFSIGILGAFNVSNALPAIIIAHYIGTDDNTIARGLANLTTIPGRMEKISGGQNFTVIVDYAH
ncbi:MAG: Mur ligase family protein, partial [bacterium]|nr:Mur ligase family protein [bacterium]